MNICVFGAASPKVDQKYVDAAEQLGEALAKRGHHLVFGGGMYGLMGAAARGAKKGGAKVTGVIPQFFIDKNIEPVFQDCDELIVTQNMSDRKDIMVELSEAFIVTPGGIGTFEEFFQVLVSKQLDQHDKPIAIFNVSGFYYGLEALMHNGSEESFLRSNTLKLYKVFDTEEMEKMLDYVETDEAAKHMHVEDLFYM